MDDRGGVTAERSDSWYAGGLYTSFSCCCVLEYLPRTARFTRHTTAGRMDRGHMMELTIATWLNLLQKSSYHVRLKSAAAIALEEKRDPLQDAHLRGEQKGKITMPRASVTTSLEERPSPSRRRRRAQTAEHLRNVLMTLFINEVTIARMMVDARLRFLSTSYSWQMSASRLASPKKSGPPPPPPRQGRQGRHRRRRRRRRRQGRQGRHRRRRRRRRRRGRQGRQPPPPPPPPPPPHRPPPPPPPPPPSWPS